MEEEKKLGMGKADGAGEAWNVGPAYSFAGDFAPVGRVFPVFADVVVVVLVLDGPAWGNG